jgi:hypothetical protein
MQWLRQNALGRMESACKGLLEATREHSAWQWDDDYHAALAVIRAPHEAAVLARVEGLLPHAWSQLDIKQAPPHVRHVCGVWGGLMTGQRLFALDPELDPMLFATWWPWGNRLKFSLRVSAYGRGDAVVKADPQGKMRAFLGL